MVGGGIFVGSITDLVELSEHNWAEEQLHHPRVVTFLRILSSPGGLARFPAGGLSQVVTIHSSDAWTIRRCCRRVSAIPFPDVHEIHRVGSCSPTWSDCTLP